MHRFPFAGADFVGKNKKKKIKKVLNERKATLQPSVFDIKIEHAHGWSVCKEID